MPRQTWIAEHAVMLESELSALGLSAPRDKLEEMLADHVHNVAQQIGISDQAARRYFDADAINRLARQFAVGLGEEAPGADLLHSPRTLSVPVAAIGAMVTALTEMVQLAALVEDKHELAAGCAAACGCAQ